LTSIEDRLAEITNGVAKSAEVSEHALSEAKRANDSVQKFVDSIEAERRERIEVSERNARDLVLLLEEEAAAEEAEDKAAAERALAFMRQHERVRVDAILSKIEDGDLKLSSDDVRFALFGDGAPILRRKLLFAIEHDPDWPFPTSPIPLSTSDRIEIAISPAKLHLSTLIKSSLSGSRDIESSLNNVKYLRRYGKISERLSTVLFDYLSSMKDTPKP
jgi:hypothetical protein